MRVASLGSPKPDFETLSHITRPSDGKFTPTTEVSKPVRRICIRRILIGQSLAEST
jgi:hypothetical protein